MPKPKKNLNSKNQPVKSEIDVEQNEDEIKVQAGGSSLSEFVKRSLPSDEEVEKFDEYANDEFHDESIDESLEEIYQGENGEVEVGKLKIRKKRGFFFWFLSIILTGIVLGGAAYGGYYYYSKNSVQGDVKFTIEAPESVMAGEEFFYTVDYKNLSNVGIKDIETRLHYPENFIFLDSIPPSENENNDSWKITDLESHRSGQIKIKGKLINDNDSANIVWGDMAYTPANFSSEFKKEATAETKISDTGIELSISHDSGVLIKEESEILIKYKARENNFLNNFRLFVERSDNTEFIREKDPAKPEENFEEGIWKIAELKKEEQELKVAFKVKEKLGDEEKLVLNFQYSEDGEKYYTFSKKEINFEVIKSDLSLNLIINGARGDQGINFGDTLNYSVVFANKGETEMKDVVIMAVLDSVILDWSSLKDENKGKVSENTIAWSKNEIKKLESLKPGEEGTIDFSIKALAPEKVDLLPGGKYQVESYAQFSIENIKPKENEDTKSNTILNKINSDLNLIEQVRYYNDDNIAVGSGPLPPKVGETTSFKVYWNLSNNLHEIDNLRLKAVLPAYVNWDNKNRSTLGAIYYNDSSREVVWDIGRLPVSVYSAEAEFNISITPTAGDANKVLVLLPGTKTEALDTDTGSRIDKVSRAKTTKLEDDEIAQSDGRVAP